MGVFRTPAIIPVGWEEVETPDGVMLRKSNPLLGLQVTYSIDALDQLDLHPGSIMEPGAYRHICFSRPNRYPDWDEMRRFIADCGFFDIDKDIIMVLPPAEWYINFHQNAFHWWQRV